MVTPAPGSGPSLEVQRKKGFWRVMLVGYPESTPEDTTKPVYVKLEDNHGYPGYWSTSKMLLECAMSLIFDRERIEDASALQGALHPRPASCVLRLGGVLTPASAFGLVPLDRLKRGGFVVEVLP